jgi:hypothetical protein
MQKDDACILFYMQIYKSLQVYDKEFQQIMNFFLESIPNKII